MKQQRLYPYSMVWNLSRPVLFDKLPGYGGDSLQQYYVAPWLTEDIPPKMREAGIEKIKLAYVQMWRPMCLAQMSTHAVEEIVTKGAREYARHELGFLENATSNYHQLRKLGFPVLVVSLADMLWNQDFMQKRLEAFLPCLGGLDFDFVPQVGEHLSQCNMWKAAGSVKSFGASMDPLDNFGYDAKSGACRGRSDLFQLLPEQERRRAYKLASELQHLSRTDHRSG